MNKENLSQGKKNVIARSRQLTEFRWSPLKDIPVFTKILGRTVLRAGSTVKGMIYSSTEPVDKFIGENISFETFHALVSNSDSALYCKDIDGHNNSWAYFGIVCNGLVRYALGISKYRYSTRCWLDVPGMRLLYKAGEYDAEKLEICDILFAYGNGRNHVALITDILRDENGKVCAIEVSEAIRPTCARRLFSCEDFFKLYSLFALCRYDYIDSVQAPDEYQNDFISGKVAFETPDIALDYGNKVNYRTSEDVVISVFRDGENVIEIFKGENLVEEVTVKGTGKISRRFDRGYYTVKLRGTENVLEFCVTEPEIEYCVKDGILYVKACSCDSESKISHMDFRHTTGIIFTECPTVPDKVYYNNCCSSLSRICGLSEDEKNSGIFNREIPQDAANFKISFENKYGIWTHTMLRIEK